MDSNNTNQPRVAPRFLVSVDGKSAPTKEHPSVDSALEEAHRLAKSNPFARIRVLQEHYTLIPTTRHALINHTANTVSPL